jgi:FixJ family two-component response regulator
LLHVSLIALRTLKERFETLTPREHEIMIQVAQGRLNKQVAGDIGIGEVTVKVHRSNLMRKMKAASLPELTRMGINLIWWARKPESPA